MRFTCGDDGCCAIQRILTEARILGHAGDNLASQKDHNRTMRESSSRWNRFSLVRLVCCFIAITVALCCVRTAIDMESTRLMMTQGVNKPAMMPYCGQRHDGLTEPIMQQQYTPDVCKTVYNDDLRFVFFAGLEGTGHHMWREALKPCRRVGICIHADAIHKRIYPLAKSNTSAGHVKNEETILSHFRTLQEQHAKRVAAGRPSAVMLNVLGADTMLSYPNLIVRRYADNPNVVRLAVLAERAHVDFRIVLLVRDIAEIVRSATKAKFGEFYELCGIYRNSLMNLNHQLAMLDRRFIVCFDLDRFQDFKLQDNVISAMISSKFKRELDEYLRKPLTSLTKKARARIHAGNGFYKNEARKQLDSSQLALLDQLNMHVRHLRKEYC